MLKLISFLLLLTFASSITVEVGITKQEIEQILRILLVKQSNSQITYDFNYEFSVGVGKLLAQKLKLENFIINEDLIKIELLENSNEIRFYGFIDSFDIQLDLEISTIVGSLLKSTQIIETVGLEFQVSLSIADNKVNLQNKKFDKFNIQSFQLKGNGSGKIEKIIQSAINKVIDIFKSFIQEKAIKKIEQILEKKEYKLFLPQTINEVQSISIQNSQDLKVKILVDGTNLNEIFKAKLDNVMN